MTDSKPKRSRIDWQSISDDLKTATGRQCTWFGTEDQLWVTDPDNDARKPVRHHFSTPREACAYIQGLIDANG
ncbi:MAG TPA: hypothetical protein VFH61_08830 [Thermoleophilia bacterium]|nr:hypothetical protein [Thermoleophilia bacterium]